MHKWNKLTGELLSLMATHIPRCYSTWVEQPVSCQLHGLSDASERAYAGVYEQNGAIEVDLIASKTRVTPIKQ